MPQRRRFTSYLTHLRFDPNLSKSQLNNYLRNPRLVILIIILLALFGFTSLASTPRVLNPEVKIPLVIVSTTLPGAGPKDVESLITIPIEDAVNGVSNVKTVTSSSQDSQSIVQIEFNDNVDPEKAKTDIQSAVANVTLPTDSQTPSVQTIDFQNTPIWTFVLTSKSDNASLISFAKNLRDKLKNVSSIKSVSTSGLDDEEIQILIKPEAITLYHLNPLALSQLITSSVKSFPAGSIRTNTETFALSIDPAITSLDDVRNLQINANGVVLPLSDIAVISERVKPDQAQSYFSDYTHTVQKGISFSVFKTSSVSIDKAVVDAEKMVSDELGSYNNEFSVHSIFNTGTQIDKQFNDLIRDFAITISLVFITLFIFLGLRQAFVALFAIPLTFFITFVVMQLTGIPLSFIAIFALLLSLGLLVDDTIVVISAMTAYFRTGKYTPLQTGLLVSRDFFLAIFTTTITTVWAFLPLLLASGIIGQFIKTIPIVVSTTLTGSFFVAMFITLPILIVLFNFQFPQRVKIFLKISLLIILFGILLYVLPKGPFFPLEIIYVIIFFLITQTARKAIVKRSKQFYIDKEEKDNFIQKRFGSYLNNGIIHFEVISEKYRGVIRQILSSSKLRKRFLLMVILFSVFSFLLLPLGFVHNEFFPKTDQDYVYMTLELPSGTALQTTSDETKQLLNKLRKTPDVDFVTADVGQVPNQNTGGSSGGSTNNVTFSLALKPAGVRKRGSIDIAQSLRNSYINYQKGTLSVVEESNGPPAGSDIQIKLFGPDLIVLNHYADTVQSYLKSQPGVVNVDKSIKAGTSKVVFIPNKEKLAVNSLTPDVLGQWLRFYASGFKANSIKLPQDNNESRDITLRMNDKTSFAESLNSVVIPVPSGEPLPLNSLGTFSLSSNPTLISRESGKRTISISASATKGYSVSQLNTNLENFANTKLNLPATYSWSTGGVNEQNQSSVTSILQAMLLSFLLIIITMVIQFSSFRKALIVMLVIPLSISGVLVLFALTKTPLSFPALIGVLALFGIVVKNSILVVDKINQNKKIGMNFIDSIVDGSSSRLEAIALTSFATIIGLLPITLSDPLWRGLGGAIIAGLAFSGTIMLFFIPIVYYYWMRGSEE